MITITAKPRRRWLQFNLKALMMLVVVVAVPCGWLKWMMNGKEKERAAVAEIESLGGEVWHTVETPPRATWIRKLLGDDYFSRVVEVSFDAAKAGPFPTVTKRVNDHSLVNLEPFADLEVVHLAGRQITDAGLVHFKGLTRLKELDLSKTAVTDVGLVDLQRIATLRVLNLGGTSITDNGLVHVMTLSVLEDLSLRGTKVTDVGMIHLKGMTRLRYLNLGHCGLTDAGLAELKDLKGLRRLVLWNTIVSDAGLPHLKGLTRLDKLDLGHTDVSDEGVAELQKALPKCHILR